MLVISLFSPRMLRIGGLFTTLLYSGIDIKYHAKSKLNKTVTSEVNNDVSLLISRACSLHLAAVGTNGAKQAFCKLHQKTFSPYYLWKQIKNKYINSGKNGTHVEKFRTRALPHKNRVTLLMGYRLQGSVLCHFHYIKTFPSITFLRRSIVFGCR